MILFFADITQKVVLTFNSLLVVIQYLSTPIYVMVSQWDSYQLKELILQKYRAIRLPPSSYREAVYLARFGNNTHRSLKKVRPTQLRNGSWCALLNYGCTRGCTLGEHEKCGEF